MKAFTTLTTVSGRKLRVNSNFSKRHFTIKTEVATFRTFKVSQEEFDKMEFWGGNDWQNFLQTDEYYRVR